jgi:hypothetical protein
MGLTSKQKMIIGVSAGGLLLVVLVVILLIIRKKEHKIQIQDGITHTMTLPAGTTHAVVTQNGSTTITQTTTPTKHIITTPKKHKTTPTPSTTPTPPTTATPYTTAPTFYTPPKSSTNGYLSDCNNAFVNTNSGGGDFESVNAACQNCYGSTYYQQIGYSLGGSCNGAPNTQDGNGYISDCNNYFVENPAAPMDHSTAQNACQKCQSQASIIQGDGYRLTAKCPKSNSNSNF